MSSTNTWFRVFLSLLVLLATGCAPVQDEGALGAHGQALSGAANGIDILVEPDPLNMVADEDTSTSVGFFVKNQGSVTVKINIQDLSRLPQVDLFADRDYELAPGEIARYLITGKCPKRSAGNVYVGLFLVTATARPNSVTVPQTATLQCFATGTGLAIELKPPVLSVRAKPWHPIDKKFKVKNTGGVRTSVRLVQPDHGPGTPIRFQQQGANYPLSPGDSKELQVNFDCTGFPPKRYSTTVDITAEGPPFGGFTPLHRQEIINLECIDGLPASCLDIFRARPSAQDGVYPIYPDPLAVPPVPIDVRCDMTRDGGGWTQVGNYPYQGAVAVPGWNSGEQVGSSFTNTSIPFKMSDAMIQTLKTTRYRVHGTATHCHNPETGDTAPCSVNTTLFWGDQCAYTSGGIAPGCGTAYFDLQLTRRPQASDSTACPWHFGLVSTICGVTGEMVTSHVGDFIAVGIPDTYIHAFTAVDGQDPSLDMWVR